MQQAVKTCTQCGEDRPRADFYRNERMKDGLLSACKGCTKARVRRHRRDNLDRIREYDRKRASLPHRVEQRRQIFRDLVEQQPTKRAAHIAVGNAVRSGKLQRQPCAFCGTPEPVEAHHHDYSKPLDVTWLCKPCHRRFHALERMATYREDAA